MPKFAKGDPTTSEYWDDRVKSAPDLKSMIFIDGRYDAYERKTWQLLQAFQNLDALDVACGYGRFSGVFTTYHGVDFSDAMVRLAKAKNDGKDFQLADAKEWQPERKYQIIFEVNSCRSLGLTPEQFVERFRPYATEYVACIEADSFLIIPIYGTDKKG